jgi:hypothetical protein
MLLSAKGLQGERARARDGDAGRIEDVYFEDSHWQVRYLVVEQEARLQQHERLVPPAALEPPTPEKPLRLALSRSDIEALPEVESDPPVSLQFDIGRSAYYGEPTFLTWGVRAASNPHLHSAAIVIGYGVRAQDGPCGHVVDLLVESEGWSIKALVVAAGWLGGKPLLVDAAQVEGIDWADRCVRLRNTRAQARSAHSSLQGAHE